MQELIKAMLKLNNRTSYKKRKKTRKARVPQLTSKPQKLGVGSTTARVTRIITAGSESSTKYAIISEAFSSYEYTRLADDYSYCRIKEITVIQNPVNLTNESGTVWLYMNWIGETTNASNMDTCDNSKLLSVNTIKPVVYRFIPPNVRLRYYYDSAPLGESDLPVNYKEWLPAKYFKAMQAPGWLEFYNSTTIPLMFTVDVSIEFKGFKGLPSNTKTLSKNIEVKSLKEEKKVLKEEEEDEKEE